jgi:hypothetical protein
MSRNLSDTEHFDSEDFVFDSVDKTRQKVNTYTASIEASNGDGTNGEDVAFDD